MSGFWCPSPLIHERKSNDTFDFSQCPNNLQTKKETETDGKKQLVNPQYL